MAESSTDVATEPRVELWRALTQEITHNYRRGRIFLAVDGVLGSGTAAFADGLADALRSDGFEAVRAGMEDFPASAEIRDRRGPDSSHGFYDDAYDYDAFRRLLVDPFRAGGRAFRTSPVDPARERDGAPGEVTAGEDAFCIVDGVFLNRPALHGIWHYSLYLEVPWATAYGRLAATGRAASADPDAPANHRTRGGQDLYLAEVFPRGVANAIIDNTDDTRPLRVFADSC